MKRRSVSIDELFDEAKYVLVGRKDATSRFILAAVHWLYGLAGRLMRAMLWIADRRCA